MEDNRANREILTTRLYSFEYVCQKVADGHEGLCILRSSPFDLVICDYRMLEMNGFQFIHTSTYDISTIPIIFTTTHSDRTVIDHACSFGSTITLVELYSMENLKTALGLIGH